MNRHCHNGHRRGLAAAIFAMGGPGGWSDFGRNFRFEFDRSGPRGGGGRGGPGGRGGRRRMFESGELRLVLLKLIADEPRHGYDLIRALEQMTGGDYAPSPGTIYPTLTLLQDMGLIAEQADDRPRKAFAITDEGKAHLAEKADEVAGLIDRLERHGERRERADRAPIKRAVGNLMTALWHKVAHEGGSDERLHAIAAILDEAAQKIERLD
ncbi:MAG: PadR family transcriptional regulator [Sphingomonas bacterium]|nr:PadR family transcriptional regulator [Sphingomonas bacterium]